jgi:rubrerythrin
VANEQLLQAITDAIRAEVEGHSFYLMAAKTTDDAQGKTVFERLAREELDHAAFLRSQYDSILSSGTVSGATLGVPESPAGSMIFSDELKGRVSQASFEITALSIGAQLEKGAMIFYRSQAQQAEDPAVAGFFGELANWEQGHYRMLTAQLEALQHDFWAANRFSPF